MPPETPRTTREVTARLASLRGVAGSGLSSSGLGGGVDVLAGQEVVVDLAERDRERLLLHVGVDERADVLEEALAELGVVGVDLAGTLGAVEHQLVLAVGLAEQVVDRGVGDALGGDGGRSHGGCASLVRSGGNGSNHQGYQLLGRSVNFVVDDGDVELALRGQLGPRGLEPALPLGLALGAASDEPADELVPGRRLEEDEQRLRHRLADLPGALEVDLQHRRVAGGQRELDGGARCAVASRLVHHRPLEQVALLDHGVELLVGDEPVVDAVLLTRPRWAGGGRDGDPDLGVPAPHVGGHGALAHGCRAGEDDQAGPADGVAASGLDHDASGPNSRSSAATCLTPRPRTRRLSAMPRRCITCRARTRPRPGTDWRSSTTRILPMTSLVRPSSSTSRIDPPEFFSRFLTSARSRREAAALSRAAWRCSGVRGGKATKAVLLDRI